MKVEYYKTDLGIIVKDNISIRLKTTYDFKNRNVNIDVFEKSNPVKISKNVYLSELNKWFNNTKHEWIYDGVRFKKLDNFIDIDRLSINDMPTHYIGQHMPKCFIVLYHGILYYTFFSGNYYPQMQLIDFKTKQLVNKWTNIKNLAPVFNCETKKII